MSQKRRQKKQINQYKKRKFFVSSVKSSTTICTHTNTVDLFIVVSGSWQTPPHKHYFPQVTSNRGENSKSITGLSSSKIQSLSPLTPTDTLTKITQVTNYTTTTTTTTTILSSIPMETVLHREDDNECAPNFRTSQVWVNEACSFVMESLIR